MKVADCIREVIAELPPEARALVEERVRFELRPTPTAADLELGARPDDRGLFVGLRVRGDDEDPDGELYAEDCDEVASPPSDEPQGVVVLFTANIRPLNQDHVREVVLHELAHFLGSDEDEAAELGVGDLDEDGTVVQVEAVE